ncbi:MAG: ATP-binding cassette domain-containing protein [Actinomycetota bacterium]
MRLHRVTMQYHRRAPTVLNEVTLDLPEGSLFYLRGANGSGKSTLLRIIAGITRPSAGVVEGRPRTVGYVPERFPAGLRFSTVEYLTLLGHIRGLRTPEAHVGELLDRFELGAFAGTRMDHLSKGTTQKVAAAQAFLAHPPVLILDESWTGLDVTAHGALTALVSEHRRAGALILFTDHRGRARQLEPDAVYLVAGGDVVPSSEDRAAPASRVELVGPVDGFDAASLPGVVSFAYLPGGLEVRVEPASCDQLLRAALGQGLSVRRVEP